MIPKFISLPKEEQAKEIRSLMRLFNKIEIIIDLDKDDVVENFNTDVVYTAEMILAHQKNIRKQIKHFTRLFNDEVEESGKENYIEAMSALCDKAMSMTNEEIKEKLKGTKEEQWLQNADALHQSGLLDRVAKKVYKK